VRVLRHFFKFDFGGGMKLVRYGKPGKENLA